MRLEVLSPECTFAYIPELESVWGTLSVLSGESVHTLCTEIYGAEQISRWKRRYGFLFETFQVAEPLYHMNIMDYLLDMPLAEITLERLRDTIASVPAEAFIWRHLNLEYLCKDADMDILRKALTDDAALDAVYSWVADRCGSFLAFSAFVRQSNRFITEFFSLAADMQTYELEAALQKQQPNIQQMYKKIWEDTKKHDPLTLSQELMGKTFHNRGPYSQFVFLPSYLLPMKACRFFDVDGESKHQLLFLTLRQASRDREEKIKALKAIADPTRYQILMLLAREGPMRGLDIARKVSIATSTVSHHMEQMKESGLITEEPVKNAKFYGLSKQSTKALLEDLAKDLCIE